MRNFQHNLEVRLIPMLKKRSVRGITPPSRSREVKKTVSGLITGCAVIVLLTAGSSTAMARSFISTLARGIDTTIGAPSKFGVPSELGGKGAWAGGTGATTTWVTSTGGRGTLGNGNTGGISTAGKSATGSGNTGGRAIDGQSRIVGTRGCISKGC